MDKNDSNLTQSKHHVSGIIHVLLSQDYAIFFIAVVLGVLCDILLSFHFFTNIVYQYVGFCLIILGTIIIYWAQSTTRRIGKTVTENRDVNFFLQGPYKITRNPTNFGLTLAVIGLGFLIDSLFAVIFTLIVYLISKKFFIKRQDSILRERYGAVFEEYSKKVKDWL